MAKHVKVDPTAMANAANVFARLPETIEGPMNGLNPLVLKAGEFSAGQSLWNMVSSGVNDWETSLGTLRTICSRSSDFLRTASDRLCDADEDNDAWVMDDINTISG